MGLHVVYVLKMSIAAAAILGNVQIKIGAKIGDALLKRTMGIATNVNQIAEMDCCKKSSHTGLHCLLKDTERINFLIVLKEMKRRALSIIAWELMAIMMTLMMSRN